MAGIRGIIGAAFAVAACAAATALSGLPASAQDAGLVARGAYLANAGGCASCHTDTKAKGKPFAGGAGIKTPFGTFYPPNITSDPQNGIGKWSDAEFIRALREGKRPDGAHNFPAFPFTSYTKITDEDMKAMRAWFATVPAVAEPSKPHDIGFPFSWRFLQTGWKLLFFRSGAFKPDPAKSPEINRGAYLSNALAHCGECHTPRNPLGGLDGDMWMAGANDGPEGERVPNITPDPETGLKWSASEIADYLKSGLTPDGDFAGSLMADVISHNTSKMTDADLAAIAAYVKSLAPVKNRIGRKG